MAIETKKKYEGQSSTSVLNGSVRIEDGKNRLVMFDGQNIRLVLGKLPDNTVGMVISAEGFDIDELYSS